MRGRVRAIRARLGFHVPPAEDGSGTPRWADYEPEEVEAEREVTLSMGDAVVVIARLDPDSLDIVHETYLMHDIDVHRMGRLGDDGAGTVLGITGELRIDYQAGPGETT